MSAIWGAVDFRKAPLEKTLAEKMKEPYHFYKIDQYKQCVIEGVLFGYGGQYFTREARYEVQPIVEHESKTFFVADAVLDNRQELFDMLGIKADKQETIADGTLMYQVLKKYGKQSFPMFRGSYSFAYYDKDMNEVYLVADCVGSRSLYYCVEHGKVFFSTLIKPILEASNRRKEFNYRFLSDYLALNSLALYTEAEETPYQDIFKVAPGQVVTISEQGVYKQDYWDPLKDIQTVRKKDKEFKKEFIELFDSCVSSVMRSSDKTGILLSGGLDSTAVACFAAPRLKERGEYLYSYTSVPEKDYVSEYHPYYIVNEKKYVEITKEFLGNLICSYMELPGVNAFDGAIECMDKMELPYKALQNIRWMREIAYQAGLDGCRILLNGQYGNATISFGDFSTNILTHFKKLHFLKILREINAYHSRDNYSRKKLLKYSVNIIKTNMLHKTQKEDRFFENVYLNPELIHKYNIKNRFLHKYIGHENQYLTLQEMKAHMLNKNALMQIGEFETRISLDTGVLLRDPTRDRRLIEFCLKLPETQFVDKGLERRLVRGYLDAYLPSEIISDRKHRGMQSADMIERLSRNWRRIYQDCLDTLKNEKAELLLNVPKIKADLELYKEHLPAVKFVEIMKILYSILLVKYLIINEN